VDGISGQTALFELGAPVAESRGARGAGAGGPVLCQVCRRPVRKRESADAEIGECCAARVGRAVMAARKQQGCVCGAQHVDGPDTAGNPPEAG
jgi:hypothetical protein